MRIIILNLYALGELDPIDYVCPLQIKQYSLIYLVTYKEVISSEDKGPLYATGNYDTKIILHVYYEIFLHYFI